MGNQSSKNGDLDGLDHNEPKPTKEVLKERLVNMEYILKEKTTTTLAKSKLVHNFQKYKEDAKVKNWQ